MHGVFFQFWDAGLTFRAESAHDINDQANHEDQANPAAADGGSPKVKATAMREYVSRDITDCIRQMRRGMDWRARICHKRNSFLSRDVGGYG